MKAKITDVAKKANVSISTVSHVLNHTRFVSEETRKKVMDAVEELGYSPDASGRTFRTGKKMMKPIWRTTVPVLPCIPG